MKNKNELFYFNYPNLEECTIQTFDDSPKGDRTLARKIPYSVQQFETLQKLNDKGAGIFFSVNAMEEGERSIKAVTKINAWICEMDDFSKEEQQERLKNCPIKPSVIIESKKSYHLYRLAKDGTKERRKDICRGLRDHFHGDPAVVDISRVLRLPGFNHMKDPDNPYMVNCIQFKEIFFTEEEMLQAYPYTPPKKKVVQQKRVDGDDFREVVNQRSASNMLMRLSNTYLVGNDSIELDPNTNGTQQIVCNGEQTGCWVDKSDKIGSGDRGGPSWVNWVMWYGGVDYKELADRIKSNCKDLLPEKFLKEKAPIPVDNKKSDFEGYLDTVNIACRYGVPGAEDIFGYLYDGDFAILAGYQFSGKTTFAYHLGEFNANLGNKVMFMTLEMSKEQIYYRLALSRYGIKMKEFAEHKKQHHKYDKVKAEFERLQQLENYTMLGIEDPEDRHIDKILSTIKQGKKDGYDLFMIDSLSHIHGETADKLELYDEISKQLRQLCTQVKACVLLIHHMNKPSKAVGMSKPGGIAGMRGSHKLADNATKVMEYRRNQENERDKEIGKLIQYKDTLGDATGQMDLRFVKGNFIPYS